MTLAGLANNASLPPFTDDIADLTMLSSCIEAPLEARSVVIACFCSRVIGGIGAGNRADPPPDTRTRRISSSDRLIASCLIFSAAVTELSSGMLLAAPARISTFEDSDGQM